MKCEKAVEEYLGLEEYSHIPFLLKIHLVLCRRCRGEVSAMNSMFVQLKNDSLHKSPDCVGFSVMNIIRSESVYRGRTISGFKWVTIGSVIFSSILLINFSDSFLWLKNEFGSDYTIPLSMVMGFVFTAYAAIVIGCNYEYIKKFINLHLKWRIK